MSDTYDLRAPRCPPGGDRDDMMEARYRAGQTLAEIAEYYGLSMQRVHGILRKRGVPRTARPSRRSVLEAEIARLQSLLRTESHQKSHHGSGEQNSPAPTSDARP